MYTIQYALRSLGRYRSRYCLFGLALVFLFGLSCVNLVLGSAAVAICDALKQEYGTAMQVVTTENHSYVVKLEQYADFMDTDLIKAVEKRTAVLNFVGANVNEDESVLINNSCRWLVGINLDYPNLFTRSRKPAKLTEGRLFEATNECVITDEYFARLKDAGLIEQVGDTMRIKYSRSYKDENNKIVREAAYRSYTVVGIVEMTSLDARYQSNNQTRKDVVFLPFETVSDYLEEAEQTILLYDTRYYRPETELCNGYELIFRLRSYHDIDRFREHISEIEYSYYLAYQDTHDLESLDKTQYGFAAEPLMPEFEQILTPLEQLQTFTGITTVTVAVLAVTVVALMSVINMRERKYELGVLRCVGMSKGRINFTLGIESMIFLLITVALGIALGFGFAALFGDAFVDLTIVDTTIATAAISGIVALRLIIAALGLSVFATVISAAFVMRARPLAILRNRT